MPDSGDNLVTTGELGRRLNKLEGKVDSGFEAVQSTILSTSSTFVRLDVYMAQRESDKADMDAIRKVAMWALGLVCSTALGAVILGIISMSGAFR